MQPSRFGGALIAVRSSSRTHSRSPLTPDVGEPEHEHANENEAGDESRQPKVVQNDGPRNEHDGLHVEDEEDEGEDVEANVELHAPGRARPGSRRTRTA